MSEEHNLELRKKDSLDRMMIEANEYLSQRDELQDSTAIGVSRFQVDRRMEIGPEEDALSEADKQRIIEAMRTDMAGAESLAKKYPNLYQEAKAKNAEMNRVADLGTLEKIGAGVSMSKRSEAREERAKMLARKKALDAHRKDKMEERSSQYTQVIDRDMFRLENRIEMLKDKTDPDSLAETEAARDLLANPLLRDLKRLDGYSISSKMRVFCSLNQGSLKRRKITELVRQSADGEIKTEMSYNPIFREGLPLLCEERDQETAEGVRLVQTAAESLTELNQDNGHQEEAFQNCMELVTANYERFHSEITGVKGELFQGSVHPDTLLFSGEKVNVSRASFTVNKGESEAFAYLYEAGKRAEYSRQLINQLFISRYFGDKLNETPMSKETRQMMDYLKRIKVYMQSVQEYVESLFKKVDEWETHYENGDPGDLTYQTRSFSEILRDKEDKEGIH